MNFLKKIFTQQNPIVRCDHIKAGAHIEVQIRESEYDMQLCQECEYRWSRGLIRLTADGKVVTIIV